MASVLDSLKTELDTVINDAVSFTDMAEKVASVVSRFTSIVPGVGSEVSVVVDALNGLDKALHDLQSAIS